MQQESELHAAIHINAEARLILELSRLISLAATNAMLQARHVGKDALGYAVVALELRRFGERMTLRMNDLQEWVAQVMNLSAHIQREQRCRGLLLRAEGGMPASAWMAGLLAEQGRRSQALEADYRAESRKLFDLFNLISRDTTSGRSLANNAYIEAAHAGHYAAGLTQAIRQAQDAIEEMLVVLARLKKLTPEQP